MVDSQSLLLPSEDQVSVLQLQHILKKTKVSVRRYCPVHTMLWLAIFCLSLEGALAQDDARVSSLDEATLSRTCASHPDCSTNLPYQCCFFSTRTCHFRYGGICMRRTDAGQCDLTYDVCPRWDNNRKCTCCVPCESDILGETDCAKEGGQCRIYCKDDEYYDCGTQCRYKQCRCCKKKCSSGRGCGPTDRGQCMHKSQECPPNHYVSSYTCGNSESNCKCCHPCPESFICKNLLNGECEGRERKCPKYTIDYYFHPFCNCPCRCCGRKWKADESEFKQSGEEICLREDGESVASDSRKGK